MGSLTSLIRGNAHDCHDTSAKCSGKQICGGKTSSFAIIVNRSISEKRIAGWFMSGCATQITGIFNGNGNHIEILDINQNEITQFFRTDRVFCS
jgi:hypothetical protein